MTLAIDPFHERVATIALAVAERHGFVLGGGLALIVHGVVCRPTTDIDLFGPETASVVAAATTVRSALHAAGIRVEDVAYEDDLSSGIEDLDHHMAEMVAYRDDTDRDGTDRDGTDRDGVALSLGHLPWSRRPVMLSIGPVMDLRDLVAYKVAALVGRGEVRDFIDVSMFLEDRSPQQLLELASRVDPALEREDVVAVGRRLDATPDRAFAAYRLEPAAVAVVRARFLDWPRG